MHPEYHHDRAPRRRDPRHLSQDGSRSRHTVIHLRPPVLLCSPAMRRPGEWRFLAGLPERVKWFIAGLRRGAFGLRIPPLARRFPSVFE
jgi:hypothetical protein